MAVQVCKQAQERCRQREKEVAEARAEAEALRDALDAERAAADAAAAALRGSLEQQHAADKATALGDADVGFRQQLQTQRDQLEKELASQAAKLEVPTPALCTPKYLLSHLAQRAYLQHIPELPDQAPIGTLD